MQISVSLNGGGLSWPHLKTLSTEINRLGYSAIYCSDHFDRLDPWIALTYLASHSHDIDIGTLVSPVSFRDPVILARNALAIDELSGGRAILGVGAGWVQKEHDAYGYNLGDMTLRMARFAEALEVITRLLDGTIAGNFEGHFYQLRDAQLFPVPTRKIPLLIGGTGPKRTLPLVARFADIWNCQLVTASTFTERNEQLNDLLLKMGRKTTAVKRAALVPVLCGDDANDLERVAADVKRVFTSFAAKPTEELFDFLRKVGAAVIGTPEQVITELNAYQTAGVEELVIAHLSSNATTNIENIAKYVCPYFNDKMNLDSHKLR